MYISLQWTVHFCDQLNQKIKENLFQQIMMMHKANIEGLRLLVHLGYSGQGVSCKTKINVFN